MKNQSPIQPLEEVIRTPKRSVIPRTKKQKEYVKALKTSEIIMSLGPAGTGKTYLAVAVALSMLLEKKVERMTLKIGIAYLDYLTLSSQSSKKYYHISF